VHPGIDDQPGGAKRLRLQVAEAAVRIAVQTEVEAERLGVQGPAFAVGVVSAGATKLRQLAALDRARDLQVMPGNRLVGGIARTP
jgi:hypothetical protein